MEIRIRVGIIIRFNKTNHNHNHNHNHQLHTQSPLFPPISPFEKILSERYNVIAKEQVWNENRSISSKLEMVGSGTETDMERKRERDQEKEWDRERDRERDRDLRRRMEVQVGGGGVVVDGNRDSDGKRDIRNEEQNQAEQKWVREREMMNGLGRSFELVGIGGDGKEGLVEGTKREEGDEGGNKDPINRRRADLNLSFILQTGERDGEGDAGWNGDATIDRSNNGRSGSPRQGHGISEKDLLLAPSGISVIDDTKTSLPDTLDSNQSSLLIEEPSDSPSSLFTKPRQWTTEIDLGEIRGSRTEMGSGPRKGHGFGVGGDDRFNLRLNDLAGLKGGDEEREIDEQADEKHAEERDKELLGGNLEERDSEAGTSEGQSTERAGLDIHVDARDFRRRSLQVYHRGNVHPIRYQEGNDQLHDHDGSRSMRPRLSSEGEACRDHRRIQGRLNAEENGPSFLSDQSEYKTQTFSSVKIAQERARLRKTRSKQELPNRHRLEGEDPSAGQFSSRSKSDSAMTVKSLRRRTSFPFPRCDYQPSSDSYDTLPSSPSQNPSHLNVGLKTPTTRPRSRATPTSGSPSSGGLPIAALWGIYTPPMQLFLPTRPMGGMIRTKSDKGVDGMDGKKGMGNNGEEAVRPVGVVSRT